MIHEGFAPKEQFVAQRTSRSVRPADEGGVLLQHRNTQLYLLAATTTANSKRFSKSVHTIMAQVHKEQHFKRALGIPSSAELAERV